MKTIFSKNTHKKRFKADGCIRRKNTEITQLRAPRWGVFNVQSGQQHQKCKFSSPNPDLLDQTLWRWAPEIPVLPKRFWCTLKFGNNCPRISYGQGHREIKKKSGPWAAVNYSI